MKLNQEIAVNLARRIIFFFLPLILGYLLGHFIDSFWVDVDLLRINVKIGNLCRFFLCFYNFNKLILTYQKLTKIDRHDRSKNLNIYFDFLEYHARILILITTSII